MGLETGSFINDLVTSNPTFDDPKAQGDDHMRLIKAVAKATFPGMAGRAWRTQAKTSAYTAVLNDNTSLLSCTNTWALSLTAAATLGNGWVVLVHNAGSGDITIDPNGAETVNGAATLLIPPGHCALLFCTGTAFFAFVTILRASAFAEAYLRLLQTADPSIMLSFALTNLTASRVLTLQDASGVLALLNVEGQTLSGGAIVTSKDLGTITSGTVTPAPGGRPMQHYINGGAHTLAPSADSGSMLVDITNNASAGVITTSGFTKVAGYAFTTTDGHKFRCHISIGNGGSLLQVQVLQ